MDGVFNTIKKCLDDIINKLNQISLFTNKTNENKSVKLVSGKKTHNDFYNIYNASTNKNNDTVTVFEFIGTGYIDKFRISNLITDFSNYYKDLHFKELKIIIDDNITIEIGKINCMYGLVHGSSYSNGAFPNNAAVGIIPMVYYQGMCAVGLDIIVPVNKTITKSIKCTCIPVNFNNTNNNADSALVCSAWIEER